MFTPESMEQLHVVFYEQDVEPVADTLVRQGALQLVDAADMDAWAENLQKAGTGEESIQFRERQEKVESLFHLIGEKPDVSHAESLEMAWTELDEQLRKRQMALEGLVQSQEGFGRELNQFRELKKHLEETPNLGISLDHKEAYSYLAVEAGRVADANLDILNKSLKSILHVISEVGKFDGKTTVVLVSLRRDREKLQRALREAGAQTVEQKEDSEALTPEAIQELENKIQETEKQFDVATNQIDIWKKDHLSFLNNALYQIKREALKQQIQKYFRKTEHTYLITGWIPVKERDAFIAEIRKATKNRCIIERYTPEELESVKQGKVHVPVQMKNSMFFKPFELITGAYGIPAYRTIDPTPILGLSFMIMFGMMFGDIGHGLVLGIVGMIFILKRSSEMYKHIGMLLSYAGLSSMVFGFLFGSLFGFERLSWLPPLWFRPMESINTLIKVCIYFGIGMIFLSMIINMINAIRLKKFWKVIFDKAGLIAVWFYWSGIVMASRIISTPNINQNDALIKITPIVLISSMILLFFNEPIIHLLEGKKKLYPEGVLSGVISGLIEVFEIVLGFLANTVSFIRIAAFGLVHAGLAMAVFALSDAVGGIGSIFVIVFGNIFIILLEALVVTIQVLRLEFYEFFSRFFKEGKVGYKPLRSELKH